jgi:fucose permease
MVVRLLVILLAFYVMGFGDVRGSFVGIAKEVYGISAAQGSLIPFCGAAAFGLGAIPAGLLATRRGKKYVMLLGLLITAAGHALPMVLLENYSHLVASVFVVGAGMTCLLVAGNPLLREVTGPGRFARDLTFAQFIKSLGSITGPYLIAFIVTLGFTWKELFPVLAGFSLLAFLAVAAVPVPESIPVEPATLGDMGRILRARTVQVKILGIFLFVGTEMGMNTWLAIHMWQTHGMSIEVDAIRYGQGLFWLAQGAGRILGSMVLNWMPARRFFLVCALAGLAGLAGLVLGHRALAVAAVAVCGASFANIWPTLFAILVETRPHRVTELAGLTVMANSGGAVMPWLMGLVTDRWGVRWCFLVGVAAFLYLTALALSGRGGANRAGAAAPSA